MYLTYLCRLKGTLCGLSMLRAKKKNAYVMDCYGYIGNYVFQCSKRWLLCVGKCVKTVVEIDK